MSLSESEIRGRIAAEDVTVAKSYLEVDVMEWFSDNEIPFGYEAFTIPSVVGPGKDDWDSMVDALRAIGRRDFDEYDEVVGGTPMEGRRPADVMATWEDIYDKHRLQQENVAVEVRRSLSEYSKRLMLPDFAIYRDAHAKTADEGFDWGSWDAIVEVSGLWGVGLPGESTESDWWNWYRVSAVAFKELAYRLLGLWDDVYWVIPNQPYIEGVTDGIPGPLRDDEHYVIINTTSADLELGKLADKIGVSSGVVDTGLSPNIELMEYDRPDTADLPLDFNVREYTFDGINMDNVDRNERAVVVSEDFIVYHGDIGEVYVSDESVHVRESQWRNTNMILIREYCLDIISILDNNGIVEGLREV